MDRDMHRYTQRAVRMNSSASRMGVRNLNNTGKDDQQCTQHRYSHSQAAYPLRLGTKTH